MPGKNKTPLLGWHPPAELSAWVRDEAQRSGVPLTVLLNEALADLRAKRKRQAETDSYYRAMEDRDRASRAYAGDH